MKDLTSSFWIKFKGLLFLALGLLSSALLLLLYPDVKTVLLLGIAVWAFCRFYYFAFYVIEHYVDSDFRFSGLWSFARYVIGIRGKSSGHAKNPNSSTESSTEGVPPS